MIPNALKNHKNGSKIPANNITTPPKFSEGKNTEVIHKILKTIPMIETTNKNL